MIRKSSGAAVMGTLAAMLAGCVAVDIDEGSVFAPRSFDAARAAERGEVIDGEKILTGVSADWTWSFGAGNDKGVLRGDAATFAPASVQHGKLSVPGGAVAWTLLSREGAGRPLIVRCGGNASTRQRSGFIYSATALPHGDVLLFDYPGSGETGGQATPEAFESMLSAMVPFIEEKGAGRKLVAWGHSLGGFVCSELTERLRGVDGVVLEATARNPQEVAEAWKPWYLGPFVRVRIKPSLAAYDNAEALKVFAGPILVLGAEKDQTLPFRLAQSLDRALEERGRNVTFVEVAGAGHNNLAARPEFQPALTALFAKVRAAP
jgi:pimeloyl-ACP methyl ester carboxylesterase